MRCVPSENAMKKIVLVPRYRVYRTRLPDGVKPAIPAELLQRMLAVALEGAGLLGLQELAQDHVALEGGDAIDEQDAVEMVHLVLHAGGEEPVGLQLADLRSEERRVGKDGRYGRAP